MIRVDKIRFYEITGGFGTVPFTQSRGYTEMIDAGSRDRCVFFVDSPEKPSIACMGYTMKCLGFRLLVIDGECLADNENIDSRKIKEFYGEIARENFDMIEVNSSLPYNALYEIGIRQAGYLKPVGLFSTPLTILIDLNKPVEYDKNWQKNLRRTENYQLNFVPVTAPADRDIEDYMLIHNEMTGRKGFSDGLSIEKLKILLRDSNFTLFFVETAGGDRIAGIITYAIQKTAVSIFSAASLKARQMSAAYFRDNKLYDYYRRQGYSTFDRGRISPAAHKKNDIFMFKNGVKGIYLLYCGEWSLYRRRIYRPLMYFVKKYLFKRVEV